MLSDEIADNVVDDLHEVPSRRKSPRLRSHRMVALVEGETSTTSARRSSRLNKHNQLISSVEVMPKPTVDLLITSVSCKASLTSTAVTNRIPAIINQNVVTGLTNAKIHGHNRRNGCFKFKQIATTCLVQETLSNLRICRSAAPFNRRVTSLCWVPNSPHKLAIGCKAGQIYLLSLRDDNDSRFVTRDDYGPGYAIFAMKFHRHDNRWLYVGSGDGSLTREDIETNARFTYQISNYSWDNWCCSLDTSPDSKLLLSGDNKGNVSIRTDDGEKVRQLKLHQGKVTHLEFHTGGNENLLVTSSADRKVKLWDVRKLNGSIDALSTYQHEAGVNNATFNPRDGTKMLTTDQYGQVRVYSGPLWTLDHIINHPHRHFQHLTPIKASWHPLSDVVVIGRYPDPKFPGYVDNEPRTIDFFEASSGNELLRLSDCDMNGIAALNHFNLMGDTMASAMGYNILIWKSRRMLLDDLNLDDVDDDQQSSHDITNFNERRAIGRKRRSSSISTTRNISSAAEIGKILRSGRK